jgi:hypothetical protein
MPLLLLIVKLPDIVGSYFVVHHTLDSVFTVVYWETNINFALFAITMGDTRWCYLYL